MKKRYILIILTLLIVAGSLFFMLNDSSEEEAAVRVFYPNAKEISLIKGFDDLYGSLYYPAVKRAYEIDGKTCAYVVSCVGYNGPIEVLAAIDDNYSLIGIQILNHEESMDYAEHIEKDSS